MGSLPSKISGSRSSAILGVSPYQTRIDIWLTIQEELNPGFCEKNNYVLPIVEQNNAMEWGTSFENEIIKLTEKIKDIKLYDYEKYFEKDYLSCHVDALSGEYLIENKTTSSSYYYNNFSEKLNRIPINYVVQVNHNMYLSGYEKCLMPVLIFPKRPEEFVLNGADLNNIDKTSWVNSLNEMGYFKFFTILRDDELIEMMLKEYSTFWNENIIGGKEPDPVCMNDIKQIYTEPYGTVIADEQIERLYDERKIIMEEIKELTKKADQNKFLIQDYMRQHDGLIDTETRDKTILYSRAGKKLASYDGHTMR